MNKKTDEVNIENVETKSTRIVKKKIDEYKPEKKVLVKSIARWTTGFQRIESNGDVTIPPLGTVRLQASEIISQVQNGNLLFNGTDGQGSHATLFIDDKATRIEANYESEDTFQHFVTKDLVKNIFEEVDQKDFEESIKENIKTRAERAFLMSAIKDLKLNDYGRIAFCIDYTGIKP
ncbi:MAG: hypothetical protein ACLRPZ_04105 [Coprococcus sp.]